MDSPCCAPVARGGGAQLSVNGRTGDITLSAPLVQLPGVVAGLGASVTLTYRSEDARLLPG